MIDQIAIDHFQSIDHAKVDLGQLTVFVGPSSSGKSAVLRALRTLVRNTSSTASVTSGAKTFELAAKLPYYEDFSSPMTIGLIRGKGSSTYTLDNADARETYAKAGVSVPDDIAHAIKMPLVEGQDLNFAFQFDRPFLLSEPPSTAAKVLGDLTNVTMLQEAAREANRRRLEASKTLTLRKSDLTAVTEQMETYRPLPAQLKTMESLRQQFAELQTKAQATQQLQDTLTEVETLAVAAQAAREQLAASNPYAGLEELTETARSATELRRVVAELVTLVGELKIAATDIGDAMTTVASAEKEYHDLLVSAGRCPTCNQSTGDL